MFVTSEAELGLNFLKTLPAALNDSLVFSPISIALVLSIVHAGAKGNSKKQIEDVLLDKASCNNCEFISHFSSVEKKLRKKLKNGVAFLTAVGQNYGAEVRSVDFRKPDAIDKINLFVKSKTRGNVERIVSSRDSIENATGLLINALAFSGSWLQYYDFSPAFMTFRRDENTHLLHNKFQGRSVEDYASDDVFRVLSLKYADPRFEFSMFLPKKRFGLNEALKKLDSRRFDNLLNARKPTFVSSELPEFHTDYRLSLKKTLAAIGITEIFSSFADLSGIADNAKISEGIHKSAIAIGASGTFSDHPSNPYGTNTEGLKNPIDFTADHPFLFSATFLNHTLYLGIYRGKDMPLIGK